MRAYAERIGLRAVINRVVGEHRRAFDPGLMVLAMVVDTLSGRSPLYHLESFFEGRDTQLPLGERVDASVFNDDNAGAALDLLYAPGTQRLYTEVSMAAFRAFELSTDKVHFDTTSVSVYGDYRCNEDDEEAARLRLTYGHSKDKCPDLKPFVVSMLCVGGNVPIMGQCEHGNASDNTLLSTISKRLKDFGIHCRLGAGHARQSCHYGPGHSLHHPAAGDLR